MKKVIVKLEKWFDIYIAYFLYNGKNYRFIKFSFFGINFGQNGNLSVRNYGEKKKEYVL